MVASTGPVLKVVLLLQGVTWGTEEHGELPAIFTRNRHSCELPFTFGNRLGGWFGFCSLCTCCCHLVDVRFPVLFTTEAHCDQVERDVPGTNGCDSRMIPLLLTLHEWRDMSFLLFGKGVFIVFKVGLVNMLFVLVVLVYVW